MPYEQPADTISASSLSVDNAADLLKPIRKAVTRVDRDTSEGDEPKSDDNELGSAQTSDDEFDALEAEDEVETESDDVEEASEDEKAEADESDEEEPEGEFHVVKVDGVEHKVTLEQMKKDYAFTAHNTRRAQALAEQERSLQAKDAETVEAAKTYAERLQQVKDALAAITPKEPDWDKLQRENPDQFAKQWAAWSKHKEGLAKLDTEQKEALEKVQKVEMERFHNHLVEQNQKLHAALPAWKDEKVRNREISGMAKFAQSLGFTEDEVNSVSDYRTVLLLRNAYKHSLAQKVRPELEKRVAEVKSITPGSSQSAPGRRTVAEKAMAQLEKSGSVEDAVAALQAQRALGGRPKRR